MAGKRETDDRLGKMTNCRQEGRGWIHPGSLLGMQSAESDNCNGSQGYFPRTSRMLTLSLPLIAISIHIRQNGHPDLSEPPENPVPSSANRRPSPSQQLSTRIKHHSADPAVHFRQKAGALSGGFFSIGREAGGPVTGCHGSGNRETGRVTGGVTDWGDGAREPPHGSE